MRVPTMLDDKHRAANTCPAQGIRMSLVKWAIFGLLMLPMVEIAVFIAVALKLGVLAALALTVLTSLAGLAIVRKGMERMGGAVGVESEPGSGSRFWLQLPRRND